PIGTTSRSADIGTTSRRAPIGTTSRSADIGTTSPRAASATTARPAADDTYAVVRVGARPITARGGTARLPLPPPTGLADGLAHSRYQAAVPGFAPGPRSVHRFPRSAPSRERIRRV